MLSGDRVCLRAIEREDLAQLRAWRNAPELRRFFRQRRELSSEDQVAWFEGVVVSQGGRSPHTLMFAICTRATGDLLGACGLCYIDWIDGTAELSVYIGQDLAYVDEALAPDACRILMTHAFEDLALRRLWVEVFAYDERKVKLLDALGFTREGRLRKHRFHAGAHHDSLLFGLLRAERAS
jgi:RimJ/RimL family protein N-acetyltransferase